MSWTDERIESLKVLAASGLSASQIAVELGGITRNGVLGKLSRMGVRIATSWKNGRQSSTEVPKERLRVRRRIRKPPTLAPSPPPIQCAPVPEVPAMNIEPIGISFFDIERGQCRYPLNEPSPISEFLFCGLKTADECSYCDQHRELCFTTYRRQDYRSFPPAAIERAA